MKGLQEPNTAMVVTIDVGEWNDVHPSNKKVVGERLALAAAALVYNEKNLVYSGPLFRSLKRSDGQLIIDFDHIGGGLTFDGQKLNGFAIAGAKGNYVWADASIKDNSVMVWSKKINHPVKVRYGWADNPEKANLYNQEGLPASPFQASL